MKLPYKAPFKINFDERAYKEVKKEYIAGKDELKKDGWRNLLTLSYRLILLYLRKLLSLLCPIIFIMETEDVSTPYKLDSFLKVVK